MIDITTGLNIHQKAEIKKHDNVIEYDVSGSLNYTDIISITKGLNIISEFYDVNAVVATQGNCIIATSLGQNLEDALLKSIPKHPWKCCSNKPDVIFTI